MIPAELITEMREWLANPVQDPEYGDFIRTVETAPLFELFQKNLEHVLVDCPYDLDLDRHVVEEAINRRSPYYETYAFYLANSYLEADGDEVGGWLGFDNVKTRHLDRAMMDLFAERALAGAETMPLQQTKRNVQQLGFSWQTA